MSFIFRYHLSETCFSCLLQTKAISKIYSQSCTIFVAQYLLQYYKSAPCQLHGTARGFSKSPILFNEKQLTKVDEI